MGPRGLCCCSDAVVYSHQIHHTGSVELFPLLIVVYVKIFLGTILASGSTPVFVLPLVELVEILHLLAL